MFVWEGSIVKVAKYVFFSGCVKEGPGKACMLLLYMYERERYIMIFYHDISVMEPAGAH